MVSNVEGQAFPVKRWGPSKLGSAVVLAVIRLYRKWISPLIPARCKYYPSCSRYAEDAVRELGVWRGSLVAAWRLARCNPWSKGGVDPIEQRRLFRSAHRHPAAEGSDR